MIHLDANFLIDLADHQPRPLAQMQEWLSSPQQIAISSVAWAEFLCGPLSEGQVHDVRGFVREIISLDESHATVAARLFNQTGRRSRTLADWLIAAVAIRAGAMLATGNRAHFRPFLVHGLHLA